ncbi:MAG: hypothetical protein MJZ84_08340 [Paludibacteraceae bacterium]|nr:hypothetical protein [Paludibacteraceae bacterium]
MANLYPNDTITFYRVIESQWFYYQNTGQPIDSIAGTAKEPGNHNTFWQEIMGNCQYENRFVQKLAPITPVNNNTTKEAQYTLHNFYGYNTNGSPYVSNDYTPTSNGMFAMLIDNTSGGFNLHRSLFNMSGSIANVQGITRNIDSSILIYTVPDSENGSFELVTNPDYLLDGYVQDSSFDANGVSSIDLGSARTFVKKLLVLIDMAISTNSSQQPNSLGADVFYTHSKNLVIPMYPKRYCVAMSWNAPNGNYTNLNLSYNNVPGLYAWNCNEECYDSNDNPRRYTIVPFGTQYRLSASNHSLCTLTSVSVTHSQLLPSGESLFDAFNGGVVGTHTIVAGGYSAAYMSVDSTTYQLHLPYIKYTFTANWKHYITLSQSPNVGATLTGSGQKTYNASTNIATTIPSQCVFNGWKITNEGNTKLQTNQNTYYTTTSSFTFNTARSYIIDNIKMTAYFSKWYTTAVGAYNRTSTTGAFTNGTTGGTATVGSGSVWSGANQTFTATAAVGYSFIGWYNGSSDNTTRVATTSTYTTAITANTTLYALFNKLWLNIDGKTYFRNSPSSAYTAGTTGGSLSGKGSVAYGGSITLTAVPNANYVFEGFSTTTTNTSDRYYGNNLTGGYLTTSLTLNNVTQSTERHAFFTYRQEQTVTFINRASYVLDNMTNVGTWGHIGRFSLTDLITNSTIGGCSMETINTSFTANVPYGPYRMYAQNFNSAWLIGVNKVGTSSLLLLGNSSAQQSKSYTYLSSGSYVPYFTPWGTDWIGLELSNFYSGDTITIRYTGSRYSHNYRYTYKTGNNYDIPMIIDLKALSDMQFSVMQADGNQYVGSIYFNDVPYAGNRVPSSVINAGLNKFVKFSRDANTTYYKIKTSGVGGVGDTGVTIPAPTVYVSTNGYTNGISGGGVLSTYGAQYYLYTDTDYASSGWSVIWSYLYGSENWTATFNTAASYANASQVSPTMSNADVNWKVSITPKIANIYAAGNPTANAAQCKYSYTGGTMIPYTKYAAIGENPSITINGSNITTLKGAYTLSSYYYNVIQINQSNNTGYSFVSWKLGGSSSYVQFINGCNTSSLALVFGIKPTAPNNITVTVMPTYSVTTQYYTINVIADNATTTGGGTNIPAGTRTIRAVPNSGYRVYGWADIGTALDMDSRNINVTSNATYTAYVCDSSIVDNIIALASSNGEFGTNDLIDMLVIQYLQANGSTTIDDNKLKEWLMFIAETYPEIFKKFNFENLRAIFINTLGESEGEQRVNEFIQFLEENGIPLFKSGWGDDIASTLSFSIGYLRMVGITLTYKAGKK